MAETGPAPHFTVHSNKLRNAFRLSCGPIFLRVIWAGPTAPTGIAVGAPVSPLPRLQSGPGCIAPGLTVAGRGHFAGAGEGPDELGQW